MIPRWLLHDETVSMHAKVVYIVIQSHVNKHGTAWPNRETISRIGGLSVSAVKRAVRELTRLGIITVRRQRRANGYHASNKYHIATTMPEPGDNPVDDPVDI